MMGRGYWKEAQGLIEGRVIPDAPLKRYTSLRVGGPADVLLFPRNADELRSIVRHAGEKKIPVLVLGRGTNLIVRDKGVRGWVVSLTQGMKSARLDGEIVEAEAGLSLQRLVQFTAQKGLTGFEPFYGIPGTVGGGLAMNAGAWGAELKDLLHSMTLMRKDGTLAEQRRSKLRFSYRHLELPRSWIILKGRFQLKQAGKEEILERIDSYSERRKMSQPLDYPSAGSIFKNPKEGPAGRWIEAAGLKGFRMGQAMVSNRHANFIVNLGKANAEELLKLMEWVEKRVFEEKGIALEREVRVVGE
jgi:UDP-N-acetylmuramate dehydrogenase